MLEKIKTSLRVSHNKLNDDIQDLIDACLLDLKTSGVVKIEENDPLILQAVKVYCKAHFWTDHKNTDKFQESYESMKMHLALCGEYNE